MGLFHKLKGIINKFEDVKDVVEKTSDTIQRPGSGQSPQANIPVNTYVSPSASVNAMVYNTDDNYFESIITEVNFPGYSISRNFHVRSLDVNAHPSCYPVSYLFSKGAGPVLAVLIMNKNQYRSMIAKGTYKVLDDYSIPYIRFFKGMENERGYVINRIRENLR